MFQRSNVLHILELSQCKLKLGDFSKLCVSFCDEKCVIKELCISRNGLTSSAAEDVAMVLSKLDSHLTWLDMSWNSLDSASGERIAEALKVNNSLTYLDLSSNALRGSGAQEIAASMEFNKGLQVLMLSMNNIDGKACFVFSKVIEFFFSFLYTNIFKYLSYIEIDSFRAPQHAET
jgi:Ran GTPase-activating protein (RanGAP) involved in mRNA processing and transport